MEKKKKDPIVCHLQQAPCKYEYQQTDLKKKKDI